MQTYKINFIDLDGTLWHVDSKPWIIRKNHPEKPLLRLNTEEKVLLESNLNSGDYIIEHCGKTFRLWPEIIEKLSKISKRKLKPEDLGVSYMEYIWPQEFKKQVDSLQINTEALKYIQKEGGDNIILSGRCNVNKHLVLLNKLKEEAYKYTLSFKDVIFVGVSNLYNDKEYVASKKVINILEVLIGYKIDQIKKRFLDVETSSYLVANFYDDEPLNLSNAENIQSFFNFFFFNSEQFVKDKILNRLNKTDLKLHIFMATGNKIQPYKESVIKLQFPSKNFKF